MLSVVSSKRGNFDEVQFLADSTNGRAYATVLRPSSVVSDYVLWLNGAS